MRSITKLLATTTLVASTLVIAHAQGTLAHYFDLANDTARQVVVDRERGQYLGHPTTVLLEDGRTMIAVYPKGHGAGAILMKRSTDGGRTWSGRLPTPENWSTSKETPTIYRITDKSGHKRLVIFSGLYPIRIASSDDDGATWTPLTPIGTYGGIVAMASLVRLANGDYAAFFHDDGRFFREGGKRSVFTVYQTVSSDGGRTWSEPRIVVSRPDLDLCEPGALRSPDGRTLTLLLRENRRLGSSYAISSTDEGRTWSEPQALDAGLTGDRHTAKYTRDGRLFITFRDMGPQSPTKGDWVAWVGAYDDVMNGRPGQYRLRLMDNTDAWDSTYPGLEVLPDDTIVTTTYGHWTMGEEPYVVSVRLTLAELDRMSGRR